MARAHFGKAMPGKAKGRLPGMAPRGQERSWRDIQERPARDSGHGRRNLGGTWKRRRQITIDMGEAARDQEGARMVCQISQNIRTGSGDNKKWQRIGGVCGVPDLYVHTCRIPDVQVCGCSSLLVYTYVSRCKLSVRGWCKGIFRIPG